MKSPDTKFPEGHPSRGREGLKAIKPETPKVGVKGAKK